MAQRRELDAARESVFVARSSVVEPLSGGRVRVVVGPRRAGKSSYAMRQVLADARAWGYANFDDERLCRITDLDELVAALDGLYGSGSGVFCNARAARSFSRAATPISSARSWQRT